MDYRLVLTKDDNNTFLVSFPDFPEAHTFGATEAEARDRAKDALATVIEAYMKDKRPIPAPTAPKKKDIVFHVPALMAAKVDLYRVFWESHLTKYALAKRLGWHPPQVDRLFELRHQSKLEHIKEAAAALGKRVEVRVA